MALLVVVCRLQKRAITGELDRVFNNSACVFTETLFSFRQPYVVAGLGNRSHDSVQSLIREKVLLMKTQKDGRNRKTMGEGLVASLPFSFFLPFRLRITSTEVGCSGVSESNAEARLRRSALRAYCSRPRPMCA